MAWTERQRRMLAEMGLAVWSPPEGEAVAEAHVALEAMDDAAETVAAEVAPPLPRADLGSGAVAASPAAPTPLAARAPATPPAARAPAAVPAVVSPPPLTGPVAQMDWPELREAVAACRACSLCESRRQTVFGVGHEQAHLMVIGEAPGEQEDRKGEPFVGPAGQLLDSMLAAIGLSREVGPAERQVFIANTLKCRPPGNRNPAPDELAKCEPFLQRQLALVRPRVILAMGRFAVQALLRSDQPVGKLRGRVHEYQGVPLVVTYHPAYLLRNLPDKARAWDDLCLAASLLEQAQATVTR